MQIIPIFVACFVSLQICSSVKVICYFQSSSWQRAEPAKFVPENIDEHFCTHIIYAFAYLDNTTLKIIPKDSVTDIDNHYYDRITSFREKGIKVLIALGGGIDSADNKYSRLLSNQTVQTNFVSSVVEFIDTHRFDGLDLDLEVNPVLNSSCFCRSSNGFFCSSIQHVFKGAVKGGIALNGIHLLSW